MNVFLRHVINKRKEGEVLFLLTMFRAPYLHLILGPIGSNKAGHLDGLLLDLSKHKKIILFKYRCLYSGEKETLNNLGAFPVFECSCSALNDATFSACYHKEKGIKILDYDVIGIHGGQYFNNLEFTVKRLLDNGMIVVIAGNAKSPTIRDLLPMANHVEIIKATCKQCGELTPFDTRIKEVYGHTNLHREYCLKEGYEARCPDCVPDLDELYTDKHH